MLQFNLPYPPSVNHYYVRTKLGMAIGAPGKAYRQLIWVALHQCIVKEKKWNGQPLSGDLMVEIIIYPPDKRKRDMDNIKKALLDALQCAGLFKDDYQICDDHTIRINKVVKDGLIDFKIQNATKRRQEILNAPANQFLEELSI